MKKILFNKKYIVFVIFFVFSTNLLAINIATINIAYILEKSVSYNNFLGELQLGKEFSTTNNKHDLNPQSELWQLLKERLGEDYIPEKTTRKDSEDSLRKHLIEMYAATHNLKGKNKPAHFAVFGGAAEIDIFFEVKEGCTCVETKIESAKAVDAYQLQMYWDGLVDEKKKIKEALLVAKDFSSKVENVVALINKKKDLAGNQYNLICKQISEYPQLYR